MSNHPFRPLRHSTVRRIWAAGMFSDVGTWVQMLVVGSLVARSSGSALQTGLVAVATMVPPGLCAPIGGLLADRLDRRIVFLAGLVSQSVVTAGLALAIALGVRNTFALSGIILVASAVGSLANPAYSAMIPDLVPPEELMAMVALGAHSWNGGRIIGPLLAAGLGTAVGPAWTVLFNAITFAALAIAVATVRQRFRPPADDALAGVRQRLRDGAAALRAVPGCRMALALVVVLNLSIAAFMGLIPIYARLELGGGTGLAGMLSSAQGLGAIVGGVGVTALAPRIGRARTLRVIVPLICLAYLGYALAPSAATALVAVAFLGCGSSSLFVTGMSIAQRDAPDAQRGRVLSLVQAGMGSAYGVGVFLIATLGDLTNLRIAFVTANVATMVTIVTLARSQPQWRAIADAPDRAWSGGSSSDDAEAPAA